MRTTIAIKGAKEHNLKNVDVELPRDRLVVITGLSGSGKSSLAFDTLYAEGQRRFLESLSAWSKRWIVQQKKPNVDFVFGLSPVVSIEQKTVGKNPRSTVGTMTDIYDYLRILFATAGSARCPYCHEPVPIRTATQMADHLMALPPGTPVEICAPIFKIYGEDYAYLFADVRTKGHRHVRIDGHPHDLSETIELDEDTTYRMEAIVDRFTIRKGLEKQLIASIERGLKLGEGFLRFEVPGERPHPKPFSGPERGINSPPHVGERSGAGSSCAHDLVMGEPLPFYFSFNEPDSACVTCSGLGTYLQVHRDLLVPDKERSIKGGAFIPEAFKYDKNLWPGRMMYSLARHYGFSLDTPFKELPQEIVDTILYGSHGTKFELVLPEGATKGDEHLGKTFRFDGIITTIERRYRRYRKEQIAHTWMETYLRKVMVEHRCPDCQGTKLKPQRLCVFVNGMNIHQLGEIPFSELLAFMRELPPLARGQAAAHEIVREIEAFLDLLLGIGLDYINLSRRAMTLSGGESQRIRLSTQIGSGLMGMLYVLDEPSIGLHPKDTAKMINTLRQLRDLGNTVVVVEHDEETIRSADHIVEIGPGPGAHGGQIVAAGGLDEILDNPTSLTGQYLSGARQIALPANRRPANGHTLLVRGARENNLKGIDVAFPLGLFICVTGASGSGKSSLVNEILYKRLWALFHDSRVLAGAHDALEGVQAIGDVINIDQTPIGRTTRSNPATYIGFYDAIRALFAEQPEAQARGYAASRFSFNVAGGRCEVCNGEGIIVTHLQFMPDVETLCGSCNGARYNAETLEVTYRGRSIAEILDMSIEDGMAFFAQDAPSHALIVHKLRMLYELGLGYLKIGHASTQLSGGEAQRIKLARELGKIKRGSRNLYILDEPTTGLHLADIQRLLDSLNRLVDAGNTVLVIEHHLDVIKTADYVVDLGPEGGRNGGEIIACGTPEQIMEHPRSYTGQYLRMHLGA